MTETTIFAAVSFQETPLILISQKADEITAAGWTHYATLKDEWVAKFEKVVPEGTSAADVEIEVREIMGEYWRDLEDDAHDDEPDQQPPA